MLGSFKGISSVYNRPTASSEPATTLHEYISSFFNTLCQLKRVAFRSQSEKFCWNIFDKVLPCFLAFQQ